MQAYESLGGRCRRCGFKDPRALQIDHVDGHGVAEIVYHQERAGKVAYYKKVIRSIAMGEKKYQLLCANCNWIKRWENGETGGSRYA